MALELRLPDLGENIESGDVVSVLVSAGDSVELHQSVIEIETDKAVVEVPSSIAGTVAAVHVKSGDTLRVGDLLLGFEKADADQSRPAGSDDRGPEEETESEADTVPVEESDTPAPPGEPTRTVPAAAAEVVSIEDHLSEPSGSGTAIPAAPSIRRLAREIGVDISRVRGSGPAGRISREDVKDHARRRLNAPAGAGAPGLELPALEAWGPVRRERMTGVRRATARHMARSWGTIPHVTHHDLCDVTDLEARRRRYADTVARAGGKLTVTAIAVKVAASALRVFPQFSSSIDVEAEEVVYRESVHIGVAVDTDRGLLVPVIRDADSKNLVELSVEVQELATRAREGKLALEEMQGGCFTITNLGGIGGTSFTPIVNWPEVAILGISRSRVEPVLLDGEFQPRSLLPLSLSYDHRIIDGADAARFLRWVASALEDPFLLALEG